MKFKMAENSLFAILLRSPWWISLVVAAAIALFARMALPAQFAVYGAVAALPFLGVGIIAAWKQLRAPSAARVADTLEAAVSMPWPAFSAAIEEAFRRDGYAVTRLGGTAADFQIDRRGRTALVSCKRWKAASTGIEPLRELRAAMETRAAPEGTYVATGKLSDNARRFAAENRIRVLEGAELARLLRGIGRPKA